MVQPKPEVAPAQPWSFPTPASYELGNGLRVELFNRPGQHVTSTRLLVPAPLVVEPRDVEGVAAIVSRTMDEGTQSHSADELAELFERDGVALGAGYVARGLTVELEATTSHVERGWELLRECLSEPVFPEVEVDRHVRQRLAEIDHELASPGNRAALEWSSAFYESRSRASRPAWGSTESVGRITSADCARFHQQWVRPGGATVVVAGDLDEPVAVASLERTLGQWGAEPSATADDSLAAIVAEAAPRLVFVDRPGSVQTEIMIGSLGPDRRVQGGWAPYPALSFVLGGAPTARLDSVLREEKGFTYGFRAGFRPRSSGSTFFAAGSVRADATVEALEIALDVLDGAGRGFTDTEARMAVNYIGKTAPARYATADAVADEAASLRLDGLSTGFVTDYLAQLATLTAADLDRAWQLWAKQPRCIVLVGDAQLYADGVRSLDVGDVTVVS